MTDEAISLLNSHLSRIREPSRNDRIYKDECVYSFDSPDCDTGLYVCLESFLGLGQAYLQQHFERTGSSVYLHLKRNKIEVESKQGDGPERKVTRLAIGLEGGFDPDNAKTYETTETASIFILPANLSIPWPNAALPQQVVKCVEKIFELDSAIKQADVEATTGTWDGEVRAVSKHAKNLVQLENGVKIPPNGWKCSECDLETNLWLNLTDGAILCGRKFFDGSGGNEHALQHYKKTGYPLAVKLGTITKEGKGDVYSYAEDDMVEDPELVKHLAHFGINMQLMQKTDKSMSELEVDLNQRVGEWSTLTESGANLEPLYGPGYTGLANMGNSCYLNSVLQVLFNIPDFVDKYYNGRDEIIRNLTTDPPSDFNTQMSKIGDGLLSGKYSVRPEEELPRKVQPTVAPAMFKHLVGRGHPDFSTKNQQDAQEYLLHLLTHVQRNSRGNSKDPTECFKMEVEDRIECSCSGKVRYRTRTEYCLPLPIPLSQQELDSQRKLPSAQIKDNTTGGRTTTRPRVKLESCLEAFSQVEHIDNFFSSAIGAHTTAYKTTRLSSFPDYLLIHLRKFAVREDWVPMKLDVEVEMPWEVELGALRGGRGELRPGEEALPENPTVPPPQPTIDPAILTSILDMGFPLEAAKKAIYYTKNSGTEPAAQWIMEHMCDPDFEAPFVPPGTEQQGAESGFVANEEGIAMLMSMGFERAQATKALKATDNNLERAADWIFSHATELEDAPAPPPVRDGSTNYRLKAFISHMGQSSMVGHYVCHILKDGRWTIFNDEKVARSENPPKDLAYLYLYERIN